MQDNSINTLPRKSTCVRCGRALSNPSSIRVGMGPSCAKQFANEFEWLDTHEQLQIPIAPERWEGREKEGMKGMRVYGYVGKAGGLMEHLRENSALVEDLLKEYQKKAA